MIHNPETSPDATTLAREVRRYRDVGAIGERFGFSDWRPWHPAIEEIAAAQEQAVQSERRRCTEICRYCAAADRLDLADELINQGIDSVSVQLQLGVSRLGV